MRRAKTNRFRSEILILAICACLVGCSEKVRIGKEYLAVTPQSLPDGHPGTELYCTPRFGLKKLVWGNYFNFCSTNATYRDGVLVFEGPDNDEPSDGTGIWYAQLYAVRGAGPVVLLTQRVAQEPVLHCTMDGFVGVTISEIEPTTSGIRATFRHEYSDNTNVLAKEISWDEIKAMVGEGNTATNRRTKYWGSYVVLPTERPSAPHQ